MAFDEPELNVPQGSVFGSLLFLIYMYVYGIPSNTIYSTPFMLANDTKFTELVCPQSSTTNLQQDLTFLQNWCSKWKLLLNSSKCAAIHFSVSLLPLSLLIPFKVTKYASVLPYTFLYLLPLSLLIPFKVTKYASVLPYTFLSLLPFSSYSIQGHQTQRPWYYCQ